MIPFSSAATEQKF